MGAAEMTMDARQAAIMASLNESGALLASCARRLGVKGQEGQVATSPALAAMTTPLSMPDRVRELESKSSSPSHTSTHRVVAAGALHAAAVVTPTMGARKVFDAWSTQQEVTMSNVIHVSVSHMIYPVTEGVLRQVFQKYGYVVTGMAVFQGRGWVEASVQLQSGHEAVRAREALHGRNIYDGCCNLSIKCMPVPSLPATPSPRVASINPAISTTLAHSEVSPPTTTPTMYPTLGSNVNIGSNNHVVVVSPNWGNTQAAVKLPDEPSLDCPSQPDVALKLSMPITPTRSTNCSLDNIDMLKSAVVGATTPGLSMTAYSLHDTVHSCAPPFTDLPVDEEVFTTIGGLFIFPEPCVSAAEVKKTVPKDMMWNDDIGDCVLTHVGGMSLFLELCLDPADDKFNEHSFKDMAWNEELDGTPLTHVGGVSLFRELKLVATQPWCRSVFIPGFKEQHHRTKKDAELCEQWDPGIMMEKAIRLTVRDADGTKRLFLGSKLHILEARGGVVYNGVHGCSDDALMYIDVLVPGDVWCISYVQTYFSKLWRYYEIFGDQAKLSATYQSARTCIQLALCGPHYSIDQLRGHNLSLTEEPPLHMTGYHFSLETIPPWQRNAFSPGIRLNALMDAMSCIGKLSVTQGANFCVIVQLLGACPECHARDTKPCSTQYKQMHRICSIPVMTATSMRANASMDLLENSREYIVLMLDLEQTSHLIVIMPVVPDVELLVARHAGRFGLHAANDAACILEFFLPVNYICSREQEMLLNNLRSTMQRICKRSQIVSVAEAHEVDACTTVMYKAIRGSFLPTGYSDSSSDCDQLELFPTQRIWHDDQTLAEWYLIVNAQVRWLAFLMLQQAHEPPNCARYKVFSLRYGKGFYASDGTLAARSKEIQEQRDHSGIVKIILSKIHETADLSAYPAVGTLVHYHSAHVFPNVFKIFSKFLSNKHQTLPWDTSDMKTRLLAYSDNDTWDPGGAYRSGLRASRNLRGRECHVRLLTDWALGSGPCATCAGPGGRSGSTDKKGAAAYGRASNRMN